MAGEVLYTETELREVWWAKPSTKKPNPALAPPDNTSEYVGWIHIDDPAVERGQGIQE